MSDFNKEHLSIIRSAVAYLPDGYALFDSDDRLQVWNKAYESLNSLSSIREGISFDELISTAVAQGNIPQAVGREEQWLKERHRTRRSPSENFAREVQIADGRWFHVREDLTPNGGVVGIWRDITDRKHAETALRVSEEKFRTLTDYSPVGMFHTNAQGNTSYNNPKSTELMGMSAQEASGMGWLDGIHPEDRERVRTMWRSGVENEGHYQEVRWLHADGKTVWTAGDIIPNMGCDGDGFIGTLVDISKRKQAETALRVSEEKFRTLTDYSPVGMFLINAQGNATYFNDKCSELMGITAQEANGLGWLSGVHPDDCERISAAWTKAFENAEEYHDEFRWLHADGNVVWTSVDVVPFGGNGGDGDGFIGTLVDITARKQAETALRQAQRMEAIGQLTGGVAHDFNNLLAIMLGNAELLEYEADLTKEGQQFVDEVKQAIFRGSSLTQRLLAFSRQQILAPVTTDVSALIGGLHDVLQRSLGEVIDLGIEKMPDLWPVTIDPHQFENTLVNLALNSRDAMPNGGALMIEASNVTLDESYVDRHDEVMPGDYVMVAVCDSGTGMSAGVLKKAFEPFFTTKEVGEGSGLGLSMVYGFVKQSKGHISIYSDLGMGTTVKLFLPRSPEVVAESFAVDETRTFAPGSERILVVDDDPEVRIAPVTMLRKQGYEVTEVANGRQAIDLLKTGQRFDLLFTDIVLPGGMNGAEIAVEAKRLQPNIEVIYTTGYTGNRDAHSGILDTGTPVLTKPYRLADLAEIVREILDGENTT